MKWPNFGIEAPGSIPSSGTSDLWYVIDPSHRMQMYLHGLYSCTTVYRCSHTELSAEVHDLDTSKEELSADKSTGV